MHIPDGMIKAGTALASGAVSLGAVSASIVRAGRRLQERQVPLIGLIAAFLLVLQTVHIPLGPGISGHLLGGALAGILLGPSLGVVVIAAVVLVATTGLGHGGVTALGANVAMTGLVAGAGGYWIFRGLVAVLPRTRRGFLAACAVASWSTVVLTSAVASALITYGGVFGADRMMPVLVSLAGVHSIVGIGEALVTTAAVGAVMTARPDLMATRHLVPGQVVSTSGMCSPPEVLTVGGEERPA